MDYSLHTLPQKEIIPGFLGKSVHGEKMSLIFWEVEAGAVVPQHSHEHEQIMHLLEGSFEFTLGGVTRVCSPGDVLVIPSHATHSGKALTPCRLIDIFSPVREEYR